MTRLSMEHKNKAKGMRKWREEQEVKKKAIRKAKFISYINCKALWVKQKC